MARSCRDFVVVVPGILGSQLAKDGRLIWGFPENLRGLVRARSDLRSAVADLTLRGDEPRAEEIGDGVQPTALVSIPQIVAGLSKSDGYDLLRDRLFQDFQLVRVKSGGQPGNYLEFPYDWRRDNRAAAYRLRRTVEEHLDRWRRDGNLEAKVVFLCHSMGGLVTRYYLEVLGGRESCRALVTFGTPYRGAVNALNFLANGYATAGVDMTDVLRSCTSVYQLLPIYEMVDVGGGVFHRVSELDDIPYVAQKAALEAREFHEEIRRAVVARAAPGYWTFTVVGVDQPTLQSAELAAGALTASEDVPDWWPTQRETGDGTVPYVSAIPLELSDDPRGAFTVATRHAMLQSSADAWKFVRMVLNRLQDPSLASVQAPPAEVEPSVAPAAIELRLHDLYGGAEPVRLRARILRSLLPLTGLEAELQTPGAASPIGPLPLTPAGDSWELTVPDLPDGVYRVKVKTIHEGPGAPVPVEDVFKVARRA